MSRVGQSAPNNSPVAPQYRKVTDSCQWRSEHGVLFVLTEWNVMNNTYNSVHIEEQRQILLSVHTRSLTFLLRPDAAAHSHR